MFVFELLACGRPPTSVICPELASHVSDHSRDVVHLYREKCVQAFCAAAGHGKAARNQLSTQEGQFKISYKLKP